MSNFRSFFIWDPSLSIFPRHC